MSATPRDGDGFGRPVVVGSDGSEPALRAVRWAARTAESAGRDLLVVHAYGGTDPTLLSDASLWRRYQLDVLHRVREQAAVSLSAAREAAPTVTVTEELVDGPAAPALLDRAGGTLLVVGDHGSGGLGDALVGSVATAVVAHAAGPVVVVRGDDAVGPDAPVVVGVDGSPASEAAIDYAVATADAAGCPLVAVHTWWDPFVDTVPETLLDMEAIVDDERRVLAAQLAGRSAAHPDLRVSTVVEPSQPARALLGHARGARLLVVGSRGRGGFTGLLLGSVGRSILHRAPCPVAIIPPPGGGPGARAAARVRAAAH